LRLSLVFVTFVSIHLVSWFVLKTVFVLFVLVEYCFPIFLRVDFFFQCMLRYHVKIRHRRLVLHQVLPFKLHFIIMSKHIFLFTFLSILNSFFRLFFVLLTFSSFCL
jgi:hypothetical protein